MPGLQPTLSQLRGFFEYDKGALRASISSSVTCWREGQARPPLRGAASRIQSVKCQVLCPVPLALLTLTITPRGQAMGKAQGLLLPHRSEVASSTGRGQALRVCGVHEHRGLCVFPPACVHISTKAQNSPCGEIRRCHPWACG